MFRTDCYAFQLRLSPSFPRQIQPCGVSCRCTWTLWADYRLCAGHETNFLVTKVASRFRISPGNFISQLWKSVLEWRGEKDSLNTGWLLPKQLVKCSKMYNQGCTRVWLLVISSLGCYKPGVVLDALHICSNYLHIPTSIPELSFSSHFDYGCLLDILCNTRALWADTFHFVIQFSLQQNAFVREE